MLLKEEEEDEDVGGEEDEVVEDDDLLACTLVLYNPSSREEHYINDIQLFEDMMRWHDVKMIWCEYEMRMRWIWGDDEIRMMRMSRKTKIAKHKSKMNSLQNIIQFKQ